MVDGQLRTALAPGVSLHLPSPFGAIEGSSAAPAASSGPLMSRRSSGFNGRSGLHWRQDVRSLLSVYVLLWRCGLVPSRGNAGHARSKTSPSGHPVRTPA